jgi:adenine deaminase
MAHDKLVNRFTKTSASMSLPDDLILNVADEVAIRQHLTLVALGKRPADLAIEVGRLLSVHSRHWLTDQEVIVSGRRIAFVGPAGSYPGQVTRRVRYPHLAAVPGFGEVHKHIESTHITPEFEAALVLPRGNTWTCEASHEFANVNGPRNIEFWQKARARPSRSSSSPARPCRRAPGKKAAAGTGSTSSGNSCRSSMSPASTR